MSPLQVSQNRVLWFLLLAVGTCLFLREWVYQSSREERWHAQMSQVLWFSLSGPRFISCLHRVPLSSLIGSRLSTGVWQTGVGVINSSVAGEKLTCMCMAACSEKTTLQDNPRQGVFWISALFGLKIEIGDHRGVNGWVMTPGEAGDLCNTALTW